MLDKAVASCNTAAMLPDDLKDYRAPADPFQLIDEGSAALALIALLVFLFIFWPVLR